MNNDNNQLREKLDFIETYLEDRNCDILETQITEIFDFRFMISYPANWISMKEWEGLHREVRPVYQQKIAFVLSCTIIKAIKDNQELAELVISAVEEMYEDIKFIPPYEF